MADSTEAPRKITFRIRNKWYDATEFADVHPGGRAILEKSHGLDITSAFNAIHSGEAEKLLRQVKSTPATTPRKISALTTDFDKLRNKLKQDGWYKDNWVKELQSLLPLIFLLVLGTMISYTRPVIATVILSLAMTRCGFVAHDHIHARGKLHSIIGTCWGGWSIGIDRQWWSNKHNTHHAMTNHVGVDPDIDISPFLFLFVSEGSVKYYHTRFQHLYYMLLYSFLYVSWRVQSMHKAINEGRWINVFFVLLPNYIWLGCLPLPVAIASVLLSGWMVAVIVTVTHTAEEFIHDHGMEFVEQQFLTTRDVRIDPFFGWVWGGMQFQLEHHLFPKMPRFRYSEVVPIVKKFAADHGIEYREAGVFEIMYRSYIGLYNVAQESKRINDKREAFAGPTKSVTLAGAQGVLL